MQGVAAWIVARRINAVLALAATISLGYFSFLSGVVLVLLVLAMGVRGAVISVAMAAGFMAVVGLIAKVALPTVIGGALAIWLPSLTLGVLLTVTRSLTLTLQLSAIIAVLGMALMLIVIGDGAEYWRPVLVEIIQLWRDMGLSEEASVAEVNLDMIAKQMTIMTVLLLWSVHSVSCVLGYLWFRQLPDKTAAFGRFRDLNLGRVIALTMAIASVGALLSGAVWLQNIAFVMFAMFWLQGLAIVHWMHGQGYLPGFGVVAVYALMPILNVILLIGLAVCGYIDAWFRLRRVRQVN